MIKRVVYKLQIVGRAIQLRMLAAIRGGRISWAAKIYVHPGATMTVGEGVRILHGCVVTVLPGAVLVIGDGAILNHGAVVYCASRVAIGKRTRAAHYCSIIDHDYTDISFTDKVALPISIGPNVWLGANVVVLKGVDIGEGAVVAAQTLVRESVPAKNLAYSPANSHLKYKPLA